ncbi:MAG: amidohydrolase, partial [Acidimicrobiaceae bacterium]|nr:amidohydrolase [Acidimicrobiaceae bacterium]
MTPNEPASLFLSDQIRGIDMHVHARTKPVPGIRSSSSPSFDEFIESYRRLRLCAVIFDVDNQSVSGIPMHNDAVAEVVAKAPDMLIGFCSVDPWGGKASAKEIVRCADDLGMRGVKFQPITQAFFPNDQRFYPLYEIADSLGMVVTFHTGTTAIGQGTPGGTGYKLKYGQPIPYLDDVAADFPKLKIIAAHPSWPWQEEALAIARHKENVYIDLSGWAPKYFPESLVQYDNTLLSDKCLFGLDYPLIDVERWLKEFEVPDIRDELRPCWITHDGYSGSSNKD